jgi:methyl-accepting chemotaxis protein
VTELGRLSSEAAEKQAPLADAAMEINLNATVAHLIFEEIMAGDATEDIEEVWHYMDESLWYCDAILNGGTNDKGIFIATDDPQVIEQITDVKEDVTAFKKAAETRYETRATSSGAGSKVDTQFDELYMEVTEHLADLQSEFANTRNMNVMVLISDTRYLLANAHLELEEFLSGDVMNEDADFMEEFKQALDKGRQLKRLAGRSVPDELIGELEEFVNIAGTRVESIIKLEKAGSDAELKFDAIYDSFIEHADDAETIIHEDIIAANDNVQGLVQVVIIILVVALVIALIIAISVGFGLSGSISKPLTKVVDMSKDIASGNLAVEKLNIKSRDETGVLADSFHTMLDSLNELLSQVNSAIEQVATGADQVSKSSQSLSQGASEQAGSLEEISASINEIASQSRQNADNATQANAIAKKAMENAEAGNQQMEELVSSMNKINESSDAIKRVVKVIDDIAFQINLLALNANVEAARAGKYGKGFAVVAEEVRNLAVKSAKSVKETTEMVEESMKNIMQGNKVVELTAKQLVEIVEGSSRVADLVEEISLASKEQSTGIEEINSGLDQIDQVTQSNTANAEESASASEELASQAQQLKALIAQFKLAKNGGKRKTGTARQVNVSDEMLHQLVHDELVKMKTHEQQKSLTDDGKKTTGVTVVKTNKQTPEDVIDLDDEDYGKF